LSQTASAIRYAECASFATQPGWWPIIDRGAFPLFGNNDNRVDQLATRVVSTFMSKLGSIRRIAMPSTQSILTIVECRTAKPRATA
jgi:formate C-acetyltransferase